jgi:ubiquinone/menaquinone biosynthesis C-methylase UbiE
MIWNYTNLAKYYDYRADYKTRLILNLIKKKNKNLKILEIGAGTGKLTKILLKHFDHIYALEPNKNMISIGKKNLKTSKKNITWLNIKAEKINFDKNFFDLIIFGSSFNVIKSNIIFSKIKKILKSRGEVIITWNNRSFKNKYQYDIEAIINKNIQNYNYGLRRSDPKKLLIDSKIFSKIVLHKRKFNNRFLKNDFILGWKSHGTLYKQAKKKLFHLIIKEIRNYIFSVNKSKHIIVPYFTNVWICKKK